MDSAKHQVQEEKETKDKEGGEVNTQKQHKSLRQLARELGVSHSYLSQVRHGKRPASDRISKVVSKSGKQMVSNPGRKGIAAPDVFGYNSSLVGESSSGRTADSGSVSGGSNPSSPATSLIGTQVASRTASGKTKGEGQRLPLYSPLLGLQRTVSKGEASLDASITPCWT